MMTSMATKAYIAFISVSNEYLSLIFIFNDLIEICKIETHIPKIETIFPKLCLLLDAIVRQKGIRPRKLRKRIYRSIWSEYIILATIHIEYQSIEWKPVTCSWGMYFFYAHNRYSFLKKKHRDYLASIKLLIGSLFNMYLFDVPEFLLKDSSASGKGFNSFSVYHQFLGQVLEHIFLKLCWINYITKTLLGKLWK